MQLDNDTKIKATATGVVGRSARSSANSNQDEKVAEEYQFQKYVEKYIVWTKEYNFMMNGLGQVIDPENGEESSEVDVESPLSSENIMPFFEISREKDFEFFVRPSNALTDFTIQFNERLSDLAMNQKMNGFAVGILKTPTDLKPANLQIGHSMMIHLPTDDQDKEVDFSFASPNSNIQEISEANDRFLNYFITSEGLGGDVVNSKGEIKSATSGIDRFLQAIQKIEAHVDDYELYRCAEQDIYEIIKAWLRVLNGSNILNKKYQISNLHSESKIEIEYYKPEMMQTETEKINNIDKKIEIGVMSKLEAIMELRNITDKSKAEEILREIEKDNEITMPTITDEGIFKDGITNGKKNDKQEQNDTENKSKVVTR